MKKRSTKKVFTPIYDEMKRALRKWEPCEDYEPMCVECQAHHALAVLAHLAYLEDEE